MFSKNIYLNSQNKLGRLWIQAYDDYIGWVFNNVWFSDRLKSNWSDYRTFSKYFRSFKKKEKWSVTLDIDKAIPVIECALQLWEGIDRMTVWEAKVFEVVLSSFFYNKNNKKAKWII
jgi:hypothetical protein